MHRSDLSAQNEHLAPLWLIFPDDDQNEILAIHGVQQAATQKEPKVVATSQEIDAETAAQQESVWTRTKDEAYAHFANPVHQVPAN